jgi:predicted CXXCH cytochrome family protein
MNLAGSRKRFGIFLGTARNRSASVFFALSFFVLLNFRNALDIAGQTNIPTEPIPNRIYAGDKVCQPCHPAIYENYRKTAMARASGPAAGNLIPGEFIHTPSRVQYQVLEESGRAWLSFDREGADAIHGRRELLYFIGSGTRGRTYIFADDGFFFESPINWYGQKRLWDMTPGYRSAQHMPLNLPLAASCLECHTSSPQVPVAGTENRYAMPIISQEGIGCERCHGPGGNHATNHGAIINPDKLLPARRDAVCMQCHLEGNVAVQQPGRGLNQFRPGEDLQNYVHYFVVSGDARDLRAASQFEALWQSKCKRKSGDSLSCTTCHDPHYSPPPSEKTAYYRQKCMTCHNLSFTNKHHKSNPDCISCHMSPVQSADVAHTQATDHRIPRHPGETMVAVLTEQSRALKRFPPLDAKLDDRDLALAEEYIAPRLAVVGEREKSLRKALSEVPNDPELLTDMGFLYQTEGKLQEARQLYERALRVEPLETDAAANLGVISAQAGNLQEAVQLWEGAFQREPSNIAIGMNLSKVLWQEGQKAKAREEIKRVLEFNPDLPEAEKLLQQWSKQSSDSLQH